METLAHLLSQYGLWGMFISAFLAGSIFPLSSEIVLAALVGAGLAPTPLLVVATAGNTLGSLFNFFIGRSGKEEWIDKILKIKQDKLDRGKRWVRRWGAWAGLLSWLPVVGELLTVAMGYLRCSLLPSALTILVGKALRYYLILQATLAATR